MGGDSDKKVSKLGRKGDARMHRAVAARLANPDLSLFEALRMGGFDFPTDDDASIMDSDQVTLGQRKNQLSRRLRLARQHETDAVSRSSSGQAGTKQESDSASLDSHQQHQHRQHHRQTTNNSDAMQSPRYSSSSKRTSSLLSMASSATGDDRGDEEEKAKKMAKYHPQFHPMHIRSNRTSSPGSAASIAASTIPSQQAPSFHPATAAALFSRASFLGNSPSATAAALSHHHQYHHASGVAVASLTATAQSVGFTLEQLAVALSSSSNLVRVLANPNTSRRQEMALNLFRSEVVALYSRCMLLAGYTPEESSEGSSDHLQIALKAWDMESKRLSFLMERSNEFSHTAPLTTTRASSSLLSPARAPPAPVERRSRLSPVVPDGKQRTAAATDNGCCCQGSLSTQDRSEVVLDVDDDNDGDEGQDDDEGGVGHHNHRNGHNHHHHHEHEHEHHNHRHLNESASVDDSSTGGGDPKHNCFDGRHVHRLEGKCGHKAIIHLPKDGTAHIDFVVDNKVECYHGIAPIGMEKAVSLWPSQYKCEDLDCPTPCGLQLCDHSQNWGSGSHSSAPANPRLLELSDLDFDGSEWNAESTGQIDETLLGLFQLGVETISKSGDGSSSDMKKEKQQY